MEQLFPELVRVFTDEQDRQKHRIVDITINNRTDVTKIVKFHKASLLTEIRES